MMEPACHIDAENRSSSDLLFILVHLLLLIAVRFLGCCSIRFARCSAACGSLILPHQVPLTLGCQRSNGLRMQTGLEWMRMNTDRSGLIVVATCQPRHDTKQSVVRQSVCITHQSRLSNFPPLHCEFSVINNEF